MPQNPVTKCDAISEFDLNGKQVELYRLGQ